jgi:hypothetical protein
MSGKVIALLLIGGLFVGMLVFSELGRRIGVARLARDPEGLSKGAAAAEAALFALLGLLIAFTFSGAASRFEDRRHLINAEANAIGTAYLRIDLLPADAQPPIRQQMRRYVEVRSATYRNVTDREATNAKLAEGALLQGDIWNKAVTASQRQDARPTAAMLLLPALNEMIDITATRKTATENHPPIEIFLLLVALSLVGALLVGYSMSLNKDRGWLHNTVFAAVLSITVYVILDLEVPRFGLIRIDAADQALVDVWQSMK